MESATLTRPDPGSGWPARLYAVPASTWAVAGFALLCVGAAVIFFVYPTYPNYDSYYALLWGREVLHLHTPSFTVYRAPTEHPLAIAFGGLLSLLGRHADRVMVGATIASYLGLGAGLYRLGRLAFTPLVGAFAVGLLFTRFNFLFLAARGYLDIAYLALIVWAAALELERPRQRMSVFVLLAAGGLLRPEAWLITALYFVWRAWDASWPQRLGYVLLSAVGPVVWAGVDLAVTGDPLHSLHSTSDLAAQLGRATGLSSVPSAMGQFLVRLDNLPVLTGAGAGLALAAWLTPRRMLMPFVLLATGIGTFGLVGLAGLSVLDRYLLMPSIILLLFAAVGLGGWSMLREGSLFRRAWAVAAVILVVYGALTAIGSLNITHFQTELGFRNDSHRALARVLAEPRVRAGLSCGPLSVPNHKLIPDARWILGRGPGGVLARSDARVRLHRGLPRLWLRIQRGVALYPTGLAVFRQAIVDSTDNPIDQVPLAGFRRVATTQYYGAYVHC